MAVQRAGGSTKLRGWREIVSRVLVIAGAFGAPACGGVADESRLPPDVQDPERLKTPSGAVFRYKGALIFVPQAVDRFLTETGVLTDELNDVPTLLGVFGDYDPIDARYNLTGLKTNYGQLHRVRGEAREARGFLQAYAPDSSPALAGHMYAVEAYAEVLLADLFCSGIPLSTVDFDGSYTLMPGFSTAEVYQHAVALFDSALAVTTDSARLQHFAAVGKGRALLALGRYADAAAAVAGVPDAYVYEAVFTEGQPSGSKRLLARFIADPSNPSVDYLHKAGVPRMGDTEGGSGLNYRSSDDPRVRVDTVGRDIGGKDTLFFPKKYPRTGGATLVLASGIEARLIEAEAALRTGAPTWLAMLNAVRTDGTFTTQPNAQDPMQVDTLWHAGSGGVAGLELLVDPGSEATQIDLLFRERAFWLYLTGHRQGDLRRLVREYLRAAESVYPTGPYTGGNGSYGPELAAPVPEEERTNNARYTGCVHFNA